jgi:four helix bundle protein
MSGGIRGFEDLIVWQKAMELAKLVYEWSALLPGDERFGLVTQIRRAAVSVPSNIAEGYGRGSSADYQRFLRMARGSLYEIETQVRLAEMLGLMGREASSDVLELVRSTGQVLAGLIRSLEK